MHHRSQFGMRKNPASDRRHGSRQTVSTSSDSMPAEHVVARSQAPVLAQNDRSPDVESLINAAPPHAATGEYKASEATYSNAAPVSGSSATVRREFEPLIGSFEAARLLGKIHVKTLQRYARRGDLPGYQIGGHWYFRASELDSWLRSRLNSNGQPADRVDLVQEDIP